MKREIMLRSREGQSLSAGTGWDWSQAAQGTWKEPSSRKRTRASIWERFMRDNTAKAT